METLFASLTVAAAETMASGPESAAAAPAGGFFSIALIYAIIIGIAIFVIRRSAQKTKKEFEAYRVKNQNINDSVPSFAQDAPSMGFAVLGFFFPLVGLIMYLVWHDKLPFRARSSGKVALAGVIVYILLIVIMFSLSASLFMSIAGK